MLIYFFYFQFDICISVRTDCKSKIYPDRFCYIYSNMALPNHQAKITDFVKKAYRDYFEDQLGDQAKVCCKTCGKLEILEKW